MKTIITTALIAAFSITAAASADTIVQPTNTVSPIAFEHEVGRIVTFRINIDEQGLPTEVTPIYVDIYDEALAARVVTAVAQWEFTPATDQYGNAIAVTVDLPVQISEISRS